MQRVNGSWYKSSIPITQFPAWNPRPGSPHPLQLMGAVGSTPSPQALGAICSSSPPAPTAFHEPDTPFLLGKESKNPSLRWPSLSNESNRQRGWCCLSILPPLCPPPGDSVCQPLSLSRGKGARVSHVIQVLEVQGNWKGRRKRSQQGKEQDLAVESPAWQQNRCSELGQMVPSCCQGASAWDSKRTRDPPRAEVCLMGWRMQESSA